MASHKSTNAVSEFVRDAARGRLSRRDVIQRGAGLGLSLTTISALLAVSPAEEASAADSMMKVAYDLDVQFLDPQLVQSDQDLMPAYLIFGRLTQYDDTMLNPLPDVAESWSQPDDTTYVFKLRPGVTFHSGRAVTADDVVFSYQRAITTGAKGRGALELQAVASFKATGPLEFTVKLKTPSAVFLASTAHWALPILNKDTVAKIATAPDGTGPYSFVEWVPGDHVSYKKNPKYWDTAKLAHWPDQAMSNPVQEDLTRIANLRAGQADLAAYIPAQLVASLAKDPKLQLIRQPFSTAYWVINFNVTKPPFNNVKLRQAVAHAIDKETIHKNVFYNTGEVGCSLIPQGNWAYDPSIPCPAYDIATAKQLMKEAGFASGLQVTFKYGGNDPNLEPALAQILKQNLAQIGIDLKLQQMDPGLWLQDVWLNKNFEMTDAEYTREPDPDGLMSSVLRKGGGNNVMGYYNPKVEQLFDQGVETLDQAKRKPIYSEIIKIALEDMPLVKLQTAEIIWAADHKISDMKLWPKGVPNYLSYQFDPNAK